MATFIQSIELDRTVSIAQADDGDLHFHRKATPIREEQSVIVDLNHTPKLLAFMMGNLHRAGRGGEALEVCAAYMATYYPLPEDGTDETSEYRNALRDAVDFPE